MGSSHIVVDGSNIATEGRSLPSLQQLLDAVDAVKDDQKPDTVTVIVDATFGHRIDKAERERYDDLVSNGELITPPAGVIGRGDAFILEVADRADAVVLSNDSFQEFHGTHRWLFDEGRLLGGKHVPGVGWIFLDRNPVRGPASRKAVSEAKRKRSEPTSRSKKSASKGPRQSAPSKKKASTESKKSGGRAKKAQAKTQSRRGGGSKDPEQYNELLPFLEFLGAYEVGSVVQGEVEQFSSHGAYVLVGDTRCYIPMKAMGDPPPRSAREVLTQGEKRSFTVEAIDTPRRGIDLSLADGPVIPPPAEDETEAEEVLAEEPVAETAEPSAPRITESDLEDPNLSVSQRRKLRRQHEAQLAADAEAAAAPKAEEPAEKAPARRTRKSPAKKSTTRKRAPAKKTATKKAAAKKSTTGKKAATKKSTGRKKAAPARKSTTKKAAPATRAKRSSTKKAATKKAAAKKSTTGKKAATKKSTGRKKAAAKKSTRARRTTKKSPPSDEG